MIFAVNLNNIDLVSPVPPTIQLRLRLEQMGMKFEDYGRPSAIVNTNPKPLGVIRMWEDFADYGWRYYQQIL